MPSEGRLKESLTRFVQSVFPNFDFLAFYPGTINAAGSSSNTFDFTPDNPAVPGLQNIPMFTGSPGYTVTVDTSQNPRCFLFFAEGDPTQPGLALWALPGLQTLQIQAETGLTFQTTKSGSSINIQAMSGSTTVAGDQGVTLTSSQGSATVSASAGQVAITGTTVSLNNGVLGVARETDMVTGTAGPFPVVAIIALGSTTVMCGS